MTWLVVGASGQLGKSVCEVLNNRDIFFEPWDREQGSIAIESFVSTGIAAMKPNVIINCAAWTDVDGAEGNPTGAHSVNVEAVKYLVKAAKDVGAVFVHFSTDYVFAGDGNSPWSEDGQKNPLSAYGKTKAEGEDLVVSNYQNHSYIFRTAWLYSAHGKNFAKTIVKMALKDESDVSVVADQIGQPTFAGDLAVQIVDSLLTPIQFGIYHGTNRGQASWFEFAQEIFRLVGADVVRVKPVGSDAFPRRAKRPAYSVLGHDKWAGSGVSEMRDWKIALAEAMPAIVSAVKAEG